VEPSGLAALTLKTNKSAQYLCCLLKRSHLCLRFIVACSRLQASGSPKRSCLQLGFPWFFVV